MPLLGARTGPTYQRVCPQAKGPGPDLASRRRGQFRFRFSVDFRVHRSGAPFGCTVQQHEHAPGPARRAGEDLGPRSPAAVAGSEGNVSEVPNPAPLCGAS